MIKFTKYFINYSNKLYKLIYCGDKYKDTLVAEANFINNPDLILFNDGTKILLSAQEITVMHNEKILKFDTRHQFVKTYDKMPFILPQITKHEFEH